jgi:hypothetical protein
MCEKSENLNTIYDIVGPFQRRENLESLKIINIEMVIN